MTLRDAQHLSWKNFRVIHDRLCPEEGKIWKPSLTVAELIEKIREIDGVVKQLEETDSSMDFEGKEALALGLSDLLHLTFVLAEYHSIELEDAFMQSANDYMMRFVK